MARTREPQMYWKASHQCYYVMIERKERRLDPDEEEARKLLHKHLGGVVSLDPSRKITDLIVQFLQWLEKCRAEGTFEFHRHHLDSFRASLPAAMQIKDLKPIHLTQWMAQRYPERDRPRTITGRAPNGKPFKRTRTKPVSDNTRHNAMRAVQRCFNWAEEQGLVERNPFAKMRKPPSSPRHAYLWPEQFDQMAEEIKGEEFLDVALVLRHTGCRPREVRLIEARWIDFDRHCWEFPKEQSKGKRSRRVVLMNEVAEDICRRSALKYPEGPIFRNMDGNPWRKNALVDRCRRLTAKLTFHVCPYALRHTFATDAIIAGVDPVTVGRLLGHKNLDMVNEIYEHVSLRSDHMQASLKLATAQATTAAQRLFQLRKTS